MLIANVRRLEAPCMATHDEGHARRLQQLSLTAWHRSQSGQAGATSTALSVDNLSEGTRCVA